MIHKYIYTPLLLVVIFSFGCGGAIHTSIETNEEDEIDTIGITAEDMTPRAVLTKTELTTAVNEKRFRVAGPVMTEFEPNVPVIYLVGKLKNVPTQAEIEVKWFKDSSPIELLVSDVFGSETFSFISSFSPTDKEFLPGTYTARIYVNDRTVGEQPFTIIGEDIFAGGPKISGLTISSKISKKMKPLKPSRKFKEGTQKLFASFKAVNASDGTIVSATWLRNNEIFSEQNLEIGGTGRFAADIRSPSALPNGKYVVKLEVDGEIKSKASFTVGNVSGGSAVDRLSLGLVLGPDNLPTKEKTTFRQGTPKIVCGLRFLDVPPESIITVLWFEVEEDGDSLYHTTKTSVSTGGSGIMGAAWEPTSPITPGTYKVVIQINEEDVNELIFKVK